MVVIMFTPTHEYVNTFVCVCVRVDFNVVILILNDCDKPFCLDGQFD